MIILYIQGMPQKWRGVAAGCRLLGSHSGQLLTRYKKYTEVYSSDLQFE